MLSLTQSRPQLRRTYPSDTPIMINAGRAHPLATIDLFRELDAVSLGEVERRVRMRQFKSGQGVVGYQDDSHDLFFILAGRLKVTTTHAFGSLWLARSASWVQGRVSASCRP